MRNEEDNDADARAALLNILQVPDDPKPDSIITTAEGATLTRLQPVVISQKTHANVPRKIPKKREFLFTPQISLCINLES